MYQSTVTPFTSSSDGWASTANQTASAGSTERITFNDAVRAGISGLLGYFEVADQVESARNSQKWKVPGYTTDGIHATNTGYLAIKTSGAVATSTIFSSF